LKFVRRKGGRKIGNARRMSGETAAENTLIPSGAVKRLEAKAERGARRQIAAIIRRKRLRKTQRGVSGEGLDTDPSGVTYWSRDVTGGP